MSKVVIGLFHDREMAEDTVMELKDEGYEKEISLVVKDEQCDPGGMDDQSLMEARSPAVSWWYCRIAGRAGALLIRVSARLWPPVLSPPLLRVWLEGGWRGA